MTVLRRTHKFAEDYGSGRFWKAIRKNERLMATLYVILWLLSADTVIRAAEEPHPRAIHRSMKFDSVDTRARRKYVELNVCNLTRVSLFFVTINTEIAIHPFWNLNFCTSDRFLFLNMGYAICALLLAVARVKNRAFQNMIIYALRKFVCANLARSLLRERRQMEIPRSRGLGTAPRRWVTLRC